MPPSASQRVLSLRSSAIRDLLKVVEQPDVLSLAGGLPAPDAFPVARMREAADRVLGASHGLSSPLQYGPTEGVTPLRAWAAAQVGGVTTEQVVITTGSQQALDLLAHALCDPGDVALVEHPAYLGAIQALEAAGAVIEPVAADGDGIRVDALEARLRGPGPTPKVIYVAPNFQNPTGATLALDRRRALAELADRHGVVVIEDDPYRELRFRGEHLPAVRTFGENVVTLGSSSKVLAPGLRVGWLAAPAWLVGHVVKLKQARDLHTPSLSQWMAHDVLSDDAFLAGHRRTLAAVYAERCQGLVGALRDGLGERVRFAEPDGGMFVWAELPGVDTTALLAVAAANGVAFVPGAAFHLDGGGRETVRLSFATLRPEQFAEAVRRLDVSIGAGAPAAS